MLTNHYVIDNHQYFMRRAIELAKKGQYTTRPNPCVGCVLVKQGEIIAEGFHYQAGQPHAEIFALQQAGTQAKGATAYVTLEPCSHYGRTPPCADALINAEIARVVIAVTDPNPKVAGGGIHKLQQAGIEVITDVCHDEAYQLNRGFFRTMSGGLPYVRLKIACSLDGKIAMANGQSKWITSEQARQDVQHLRAISGAIITGSETVLKDNPALNVRSQALNVSLSDIPQPLLTILDRRKRLSTYDTWYQQQQAQRPILLIQDNSVKLAQILQQLSSEYQIHDVLIEAGATLSSAFLQEKLVDELIVYQAPCFLGRTAQPMINFEFSHITEQLSMRLVSHENIGKDLKLIFTFN